MMRLYPMALKLTGRRCVVVGGGTIAERKVASLVECDAQVVVVSPALTPSLEAMAARSDITVIKRPFEPSDAAGAVMVIAATNDSSVNEAVTTAAHAAGALVNVVDVPHLCDFYVPASFTRGDLQITISTSGACPALAKRLREELETHIGPEYEAYAQILASFRKDLRTQVTDAARRKAAEEALLSSPALELVRAGRIAEAASLAADVLAEFSDLTSDTGR